MPAVPENPDMSTVEQKLKLKRLHMLPSSATGDGKGKVQIRTVGGKLRREILPSLRFFLMWHVIPVPKCNVRKYLHVMQNIHF